VTTYRNLIKTDMDEVKNLIMADMDEVLCSVCIVVPLAQESLVLICIIMFII